MKITKHDRWHNIHNVHFVTSNFAHFVIKWANLNDAIWIWIDNQLIVWTAEFDTCWSSRKFGIWSVNLTALWLSNLLRIAGRVFLLLFFGAFINFAYIQSCRRHTCLNKEQNMFFRFKCFIFHLKWILVIITKHFF